MLVYTHHHRNRLSYDDTSVCWRSDNEQSREEEGLNRHDSMDKVLADDRMLLERPGRLDPEEHQDQEPSTTLTQSHQSQGKLAAKGSCDGNDSPRHASERYDSDRKKGTI